MRKVTKNEFLLLNNSNKFSFDSSEFKYFLAGFIEGEGSLSVSIKKNEAARFGYFLDPEFFLYQHYSGLPILENAMLLFRSGRLFKKSGSENVWVYGINNRKVISEKVIPYFLKYVIPFSCKYIFITDFISIIEKLEKKEHFELAGFLEILELVYKLNPNSKGKERKIELEVLKNNILRDYTLNKNKL